MDFIAVFNAVRSGIKAQWVFQRCPCCDSVHRMVVDWRVPRP